MLDGRKFSILGDGGWAHTLSILLHEKSFEVLIWSPSKEYAEYLKKYRKNPKYFPEVDIPKNIKITSSLKEAVDFSKYLLLVIPTKFLREVLRKLKKLNIYDKIFLSCSKGIEEKTFKRPSEIIKEFFEKPKLAVLSGPTIAREVIKKNPTLCIVASKEREISSFWQKVLSTDYFRVYISNDIVGTELGGALKNIIAIACGIVEGLNLGTNTKAALLSRGLVEIVRFCRKFGAKKETLFGLAGLGDLVTTCFNKHSRNRTVGELIAKGYRLKEIEKSMEMVAEGIYTVKAVYKISKKFNIEMPITTQVYKVLYKNKSPLKAIKELMRRRLKEERI